MIIKSSQRAGHRELAAHLTKCRDIDGTPQTVTISSSRDLVNGEDVHQALGDMAILAMASNRCQKDLYHISLNPDQPMTEQDWLTVWQLYEDEFGLNQLPYIEVTHAKGDNRPPHRHRVYERVDIKSCKAVQLSHTRIRNELVARKIEFALGHALTIGKHNRTVMKRLEQDGEQEMLAWMRQGHAHDCDRPVANQNHADVQMEKHTKLCTAQVKADLQACYARTDNGQSFQAAIAEKGYQLAQGERRDFVVVDIKGGIHSPRRRLGVKAKELRQRWADLEQVSLPHVDTVVEKVKTQLADSENDSSANAVASKPSADRTNGVGDNRGLPDDTSLSDLQQEATEIAAEIEQLEATITAEGVNQLNDEVWNYWQRQSIRDIEPERRKPRSRVSNRSGRGGKPKSSNTKNEDLLLKLQGQDAIAERQRRLWALSQPMPGHVLSNQPMSDHAMGNLSEAQALPQGMVDYQRFWQERFKGQTTQQLAYRQAYRLVADRWILKRLASRGYSRNQARAILMRSSPELMNQRPNQRLGYIRRMVNQVYTPYEQQQRLTSLKENSKQKTSDTRADTRDMPKLHRSKSLIEKPLPREPQPPKKPDKSIDRSPEHGLER